MESHLSTIPEYAPTRLARLQSLYSDFTRQKQANPTAFASNVEWWYRLLRKCLEEGWLNEADLGDDEQDSVNGGDRLILSVRSTLPEQFRWGRLGRPLALPTVLSELSSSQPPRIISLKQFMASSTSIYHTDGLAWRIASYVVGKPLWWALEQMKLTHEENVQAPSWNKLAGDYVFTETLENVADAIISKWRESASSLGTLSECLHSLETLVSQFATIGLSVKTRRKLSQKDMEVVVKYLSRDRQFVVVEREVIKLVDDPTTASITAVDHGVLEMKSAILKLESQVDEIQNRIERLTAQVRESLRQSPPRKVQALSRLRAKKTLEEDLLPKRLRSLEMIQSSLDNVERARGDIEIMKAYETSTTTLRTLLSDPALRRENVEGTLESMREAHEEFKEIDDIIRIEADANTEAVDDDELAKELEDLVEDSKREREESRIEKQKESEKEEKTKEEEDLKESKEEEGRATGTDRIKPADIEEAPLAENDEKEGVARSRDSSIHEAQKAPPQVREQEALPV